MTDRRNDDPPRPARIVRLGARRPETSHAGGEPCHAEPFRSTEALATLADELVRFESAAQEGTAKETHAPQVAELAAMRGKPATRSPLSLRKNERDAPPAAPAVPLPTRRRKPKST